MKKMLRCLSFLVALALILQLTPVLPISVRAEGESLSYITVDGWVVMSGKYMASDTRQVLDTKPETGGYLYFENGHLLLNNFTCSSNADSVILSEQELTVELVGENTLSGGMYRTFYHTTDAPLTIQGTGSLTVTGTMGGIIANGNLTLNADITATATSSYGVGIGANGNLYIEGGTIQATSTKAAALNGKNTYLNGGTVVATGCTRGLSTGLLEINGGDLTAISTDATNDSSNYAIAVRYSMPESYMKINNGAQILAATEPDGTPGKAEFAAWKDYDYIRIYDAGVDVDGIHLSSGEYLSQGSDTPATGTPTGSYAIYEGGVLTLNDFEGGGIHGFGDLKLNVQGTNRLTGQIVMENALAIEGTGSLEIAVNSQDPAVLVQSNMTVESGTLVITNAVGLGCELDSLHINNGNVTINGGVLAYGMVINNGSCRITSDSAYPAVEIIPIDESSTGSVTLYGGSLELSSAQTSALVGPLYMAGGEFFAETGTAGCRVVTDLLVRTYWDGYEYLCADQPGGELKPCYDNEMGQFSRIRIGLHTCAPTLVEEIKPTCGDSGKLAYYRCFCGKYYEDAAGTVLIPYIYEYGNLDPLGHDISGVEYTVTDTEHYKLCKVCGAQEFSTWGYHDFGDGLYCVCGCTRMGNIYGVVTNEIATTVTFRLWQGDTLVNEYITYGQNFSYGLYNIEPGTYRLEVEGNGYARYEAEIVMDRYQVEHNVVLPPKINTISGSVSSDIGWTNPVSLNLYRQGNLLQTVTTEGSPAYFTFENLPTGIYWMEIIKKDHEYIYQQVEVIESSDEWNYMLSVLRGDITGTINCDVRATSQAHLELHMDGELAGVTGVDPNGGSIDLFGYPVGSYLLTVTLSGYKKVELPVYLSTSGVHLDITMEALKADVSVTGKITCFLTDGEVKVELLRDGTVIHTAVVTGKNADFAIEGVENGVYTLRTTKENHTPLEQTVEIGDQPLDLNVKICPKGDTSGDGAVNAKDYKLILQHINKSNSLIGYALDCANVNGDTNVNAKDMKLILQHINKSKPLF